jgi:nicotinamidase-related amidase
MKATENKDKTALLVMDVQGATMKLLKEANKFINLLADAIKLARENQIPVIYIVVGFRKGYPDVSRNNKSFSVLKSGQLYLDQPESMTIPASVSPLADDVVITKKRVSAFTGSDLEVVLRSLEIKHIILAGIATGGVVLSTLREAADKDYKITILSDCCADADDEVHRILINKVFPKQAEVINSKELKLL